ncbi:lytic transglycosylase domain-containing protein [Sulfitobacter aestuarii]|uniref:Lytic transglycosylase domain-containing protein n=1 Tax=Sulfitobacter aestuarii TaxID=2161676 RepID=A0ABW5U116_9RHOB
MILGLYFLSGAALAEPPQKHCSSSKWGQSHCIRPAHFAYDTCNAIEIFAKRHGLDQDFFARLIWQESRFDPNALSHANARGIAQFIPSTAALRGLVDPYNPADALEHSAQYLAEMVSRYGNEGLAAIGYNGGERRAEGFLKGRGLAPETVQYVPIITGLSAEAWRDAPPVTPDFRLSKSGDFQAACLDMARNRRLTSLKVTPVLKPWGVQVGYGVSEGQARARVKQALRSCRSAAAGERLDVVARRTRVSAGKRFHFAHFGRNSRKGAQQLCAKLQRSGCLCLVVKK